jgi:hypothetical protein
MRSGWRTPRPHQGLVLAVKIAGEWIPSATPLAVRVPV